ncbi:MAG: MFS transporter [Planctomycetes bacterium]|nr:MFS transporter [Planctomycetota bacterium]
MKWWICGLLLLATTLNYMDRQALSQTSTQILEDFGLNDRDYSKFGLFFNVGFGIGALLFGWLVDKGNLRWIYAGLVLGWSMVGFATGYATAFVPLIVCRLLLGIFEAGNWPCGILTVKRVLKPEERSLGNGMFQSGTALGAILIPLVVFALVDPKEPRTWQLPFRVIGAIGVLWVLLWLIVVKERHVAPPPSTPSEAKRGDSYWDLWKDRRFYVLIVVIVGVNTPWRTFSEWLPRFLQKSKGFTFEESQLISSAFYLSADVGSIISGIITLYLARRGRSLFSSRMVSFVLCAALTALLILVVAIPKEMKWWVIPPLMLVAFGTLGSFSTYFAFSQEVSSKHQGKVTGTLGLINSICMGLLVRVQGEVIELTKSYDLAFGLTALAPLIAVVVVYFFWEKAPASDKTSLN